MYMKTCTSAFAHVEALLVTDAKVKSSQDCNGLDEKCIHLLKIQRSKMGVNIWAQG